MEEVDAIVIHTLRQIGCEIEEDLNLKEFSTEIVIEGVVRCLRIINSKLEFSHHVPQSMSARYRLCSALAAELLELGFKGEMGYQTFLYSNEHDVRKIFLFLLEKLPKESEKALEEPLGKVPLILKEAGLYFRECMNTFWMPHYCRSIVKCDKKVLRSNTFFHNSLKTQMIFIPRVSKSWSVTTKSQHANYCSDYMFPLCKQVTVKSTLFSSILFENQKRYVTENKSNWSDETLLEKEASLTKKDNISKRAFEFIKQAVQKISLNEYESLGKIMQQSTDNDAVKGSRFFHILELQSISQVKQTLPTKESTPEKKVNKEEDHQIRRENEIGEIQQKVDTMVSNISQLELQNKKLEDAIQHISDFMQKETEKINSIQETYRVKKCTLSLLPDAENNLEKLQNLIDSSSQKLINLAQQWEQHRVPLIEKYRELKEVSSERQNETQRKLEEIKQKHDKIREIGVEAQHKEELHKKLIASYEKLTKDLNRSAYTRRILEIVSNIKKQKNEINKVLLDTKNVQKEINRLSGKLERTFTVTDELIFRDAKKDEAVRRAYKLLAALHENCNQLVQITEDTGVIVREIRELEDQVEQENQKKIIATLERITSDYKQMQQENASLIAQLK